MPDTTQLMHWMELHPGLTAATVGLILSSSYVLLMVVTRLGDIKPGVQTLVLSALIHFAMACFWGNLTLPGGKVVGQPLNISSAEPIAIREVIVEESRPDAGGADATTADGTGTDSKPVWDRLPAGRPDGFQRIDASPITAAPVETPDRTAEVLEPVKGVLPQLPMPDAVAVESPSPAKMVEPAKRVAADENVALDEETAESRPGVATSDTGPARAGGGVVAGPSEPVERTSRPGSPPRGNVTVQMPAQGSTTGDLPDDAAIARKNADSQLVARRTGPAPVGVVMDESGTPEGVPGGTGAGGTAGSSKFSRVGSPSGTGNGAGTATARSVERGSSTERTAGTGLRAPEMASLGGGGLNGVNPSTDRPGISRPSFGAIPQRGSAKVADTYRLRNLPQRQKVAVQLGATKDSERAVETSLRWLALHQNPEGYWDADGYDLRCPEGDRCWGKAGRGDPKEVEKVNNPVDRLALASAGQQADTGLTALIVLTFLGAGYTQEEGLYADQIDRALRWMVRQQQSNGYLGGNASHYERMYCHGMATYALGEACGMMADPDSDPQLRQALAKAVNFIVAMQNPADGGWRYIDGKLAKQEGDMSMFGWQLMALKSSQIAGVDIPEESQAGMVRFLKRISLGEKRGLASYRFGEAPKASMTAEALFCRQMLGMKRDNPSSLEAVDFLVKHPPHQTEQDLYYWYYGTLAMYQYGGEPWRRWNDQLRDTLVATQRKTGHAAGSWDPRDNWSLHGGRLYSTALSTLCLEVYYRFLPLYQLNGSGLDDMEN